MLCNRQNIAEYEAYWLMGVPIINPWGARFMSIYSSYFPLWLNGLQRCFSCCCLLILLCNGQNIAKYKAYWLINVPIIYPCGVLQPAILSCKGVYAKIIMFSKN